MKLAAIAVVLTILAAVSLPLGALEAQKIAEIHATGNESLFAFLKRLPTSFEAQVFYGLFVSGLIGMLGSWLWKISQGMADWHHFSSRYLLGQILWLAGSAVAAIFTVGFSTDSGEFFGWLAVLWSGGFAGFSGEVKVKRDAA